MGRWEEMQTGVRFGFCRPRRSAYYPDDPDVPRLKRSIVMKKLVIIRFCALTGYYLPTSN
jgi:hypothetical protein